MIDPTYVLSPILDADLGNAPTVDELRSRARRRSRRVRQRWILAVAPLILGVSITAAVSFRHTSNGEATVDDQRNSFAVGSPSSSLAPTRSYQLVDVSAPISDGLTNRPDLHEVLNPPVANDQRPISADEIFRLNDPGIGSVKLYFGRYSIDVPSDDGVPIFSDTPVWLLVADAENMQPCRPLVGPAYRPGRTITTLPSSTSCASHTVVVVDPSTGAPRFKTVQDG